MSDAIKLPLQDARLLLLKPPTLLFQDRQTFGWVRCLGNLKRDTDVRFHDDSPAATTKITFKNKASKKMLRSVTTLTDLEVYQVRADTK